MAEKREERQPQKGAYGDNEGRIFKFFVFPHAALELFLTHVRPRTHGPRDEE